MASFHIKLKSWIMSNAMMWEWALQIYWLANSVSWLLVQRRNQQLPLYFFIITGWKLIVLYIIYLSSPLCFPSQIIKDFPSQSLLVFLSGFPHLSSKLFTLPFEAHISHMSLECGWHDKLRCSTSDASSCLCYHSEKRTQGSDFFLLFTSWQLTRPKFLVNKRRNEKYFY